VKPVMLGGIAFGITVIAVVGAWSTNQAIAWWVSVPDMEFSPAPEQPQAEPESGRDFVAEKKRSRTKRQLVDGIMARNIFDHTSIGAMQAPVDVAGGEELTDLKLRLLATMVAEPASFSSALIANDDAGGQSNGYGIGDTIVSGAVIVEIEKKRVVLERNGNREILVFDEKDAPKRSSSRSNTQKTDDETGIAEAGDNKFTIPRDTLDKYISDMDAISSGKHGRARPHRDEGGSIDGFRLSGIRRNSLGSKLGIKTGDVVHSVNGKPLTNVKEAMDAFSTLQNDNSFSFEITRRGQKQTMEYSVR